MITVQHFLVTNLNFVRINEFMKKHEVTKYSSSKGRLVFVGKGDKDIVNCVAPNPFLPQIATSGIEDDVKLWEPIEEAKADAWTTVTNVDFLTEICDVSQILTTGEGTIRPDKWVFIRPLTPNWDTRRTSIRPLLRKIE